MSNDLNQDPESLIEDLIGRDQDFRDNFHH